MSTSCYGDQHYYYRPTGPYYCRHRQVDICFQCLVGIRYSASDLQRLEAFICRSDRSGFVPANLRTFADLCQNADENLFAAISHRRLLPRFTPPPSASVSRVSTLQPTSTSTQLRRPLSNWSSQTRTSCSAMLYLNSYDIRH